jgi:RimK family alpha-L-glutamate ligase
MAERGVEPVCFFFNDLVARIGAEPRIALAREGLDVGCLPGIVVRPIGRGSLDEVILRIDLLHRIEREGVLVVNPPRAIERAVDKYYALTLMEDRGLPVARTMVAEDPSTALKAFEELGGDVVVKPLFGSRGLGITRVSDYEVARRIFHTLRYAHHILYLQEFTPHGCRDIRAFVVDGQVVAAIYRVGEGWKTNVSLGAKPVPMKPDEEVKELAVKAAETLGCYVAGVDLMEGPEGYRVTEINSQPGFRGLQTATGVNIAGAIVDFMLSRLKR